MSHFSISELTFSLTAIEKGIDNTPDDSAKTNLVTLISACLDPIREIYGKPIYISSGYRNDELNRAVKGSESSQHKLGQAADLVPAQGGSLSGIFRAAVQFGEFDQLIIEQSGGSKWIHISYSPRHRKEILAYKDHQYLDISSSWEKYIEDID